MDTLLGMLDALNLPREQLFRLLGSADGSGAGLLNEYAGVDPASALGRYGGFAAEAALDPLNLFGAGATRQLLKGVEGLGAAAKAGRVADATADLSAGRRLEQIAADAPGTFNPATMGPGGLPLSSRAALQPEMMAPPLGLSQSQARRVPANANYPTFMTGGDAVRYQDNTRRQMQGALGEMYPGNMTEAADLLNDYRYGQFRRNAGANAASRDLESLLAEFADGRPQLTVGDMAGADAAMIAEVARRNRPVREALASAGPSMDATGLKADGLVSGLEAALAAATGSRAVNPLVPQAILAGAGGAWGGYQGTRGMRA